MGEVRKQIGEKFSFAVDFAPKLPTNVGLQSGLVLATRKSKATTTTLQAPASAGDITITLGVDVKSGAQLIINPGHDDEEAVVVASTVGPVATLVSRLQLAHANGVTVKYELGESDLVLASTTAGISGTQMKANVIGGLVYTYQVLFFATLTTGDVIREDVDLVLHD